MYDWYMMDPDTNHCNMEENAGPYDYWKGKRRFIVINYNRTYYVKDMSASSNVLL